MLTKRILICPAERLEVPFLAAEAPLAAVPALGYSLLEYWMSHWACAGMKQVVVLASERVDEVRQIAGDGSRWGMATQVVAEPQELTCQQAAEKHGAPATVMDHFPELSEKPLFESYEGWFSALMDWMPRARTPHRVGLRELQPGVWVGLHTHISKEARLCPPVWLGDHVYVGPGAVIGPSTILENGAFIEPEAEIHNSVIGPSTFVGQYVQITESLAWGSTLVNWRSGQEHKVYDAFLMCSLISRRTGAKPVSLLKRAAHWLGQWKEDQALNSPHLTETAPVSANAVMSTSIVVGQKG